MGADLVLHFVWIARGQEPRWADAAAAIQAMTTEQLNALEEIAFGDVHDPDEYRQGLLTDLEEIKGVWHSDRRTAYRVPLGPIDCLVSGGVSWGDSPDDFYNTVSRFLETPGPEAAGFFVWPIQAGDRDESGVEMQERGL